MENLEFNPEHSWFRTERIMSHSFERMVGQCTDVVVDIALVNN